MIEIGYLREKEAIKHFQYEVQETILRILQILETEYGADRDKYEDDGGYVIVVEKDADLQELKNEIHINCYSVMPEYVDKITCNNGEVYTNSLILCNNDYGISLIIPMEFTPQNLKDYMID